MKRILIISSVILPVILVLLIHNGRFVKRSEEYIKKELEVRDRYTFAMNPIYKRESEKFMASEKKADIVMLGNSITSQAEWSVLLNRDDVLNRGISGDITEGMLKRLDSVLKAKPEFCFFMGGINDITRRIPYVETLNNIKEISRILKKNGITPVVQSVLYTDDRFFSSEYNNPIVTKLNDDLIKFCGDENIVFLDINRFMSKNQKIRHEYSDDGLHLNANGYAVWGRILQEFLDKCIYLIED